LQEIVGDAPLTKSMVPPHMQPLHQQPQGSTSVRYIVINSEQVSQLKKK
jgi:hypothetical protein